jgi:hypothetical protein
LANTVRGGETLPKIRRTKMKAYLKHLLNPLHVYCRVVDLTGSKSFARFICYHYEKRCWRLLYGDRNAAKEWKKNVRRSAQQRKSPT